LLRGMGLHPLKLFNTRGIGPAQADTQLKMSDLHTLSDNMAQTLHLCLGKALAIWHHDTCMT